MLFAMVMAGVTRGLAVGVMVWVAVWVFAPIEVLHWGVVLLYAVSATLMLSLLGMISGICCRFV